MPREGPTALLLIEGTIKQQAKACQLPNQKSTIYMQTASDLFAIYNTIVFLV